MLNNWDWTYLLCNLNDASSSQFAVKVKSQNIQKEKSNISKQQIKSFYNSIILSSVSVLVLKGKLVRMGDKIKMSIVFTFQPHYKVIQ